MHNSITLHCNVVSHGLSPYPKWSRRCERKKSSEKWVFDLVYSTEGMHETIQFHVGSDFVPFSSKELHLDTQVSANFRQSHTPNCRTVSGIEIWPLWLPIVWFTDINLDYVMTTTLVDPRKVAMHMGSCDRLEFLMFYKDHWQSLMIGTAKRGCGNRLWKSLWRHRPCMELLGLTYIVEIKYKSIRLSVVNVSIACQYTWRRTWSLCDAFPCYWSGIRP